MKNTIKLLFPFLALVVLVTPAWSLTATALNPTHAATFAPMVKSVFGQPSVTPIFVARGGGGGGGAAEVGAEVEQVEAEAAVQVVRRWKWRRQWWGWRRRWR